MSAKLSVLYLEPFGGGSHRAFYDGWSSSSSHRFQVLSLPANHWKWRSRHAAVTLAEAADKLVGTQEQPQVVVASSMLELASWRGLVAPELAHTPAVLYFHENQFTYPLSEGQTRDYHYAYSQLLSTFAADEVWFNSQFHAREFFDAAAEWLARMPDGQKQLPRLEKVEKGYQVCPPGISPIGERLRVRGDVGPRPMIGWVGRWEHDKNPDRFVALIEHLIASDRDFDLVLLGQRFSRDHPALKRLSSVAADRILFSGYAESQADYWQWLSRIDIVVSTAQHEFFGIAVVEAISAGALPCVPYALAYPEVLAGDMDGSAPPPQKSAAS
ncbi:MAG TPA: DUF3524 domain-containing protein, partial [Planctomycetaceae bacterium]|nr:DUF3524 domain-containing protein [Planctomycetaceae bacterium]